MNLWFKASILAQGVDRDLDALQMGKYSLLSRGLVIPLSVIKRYYFPCIRGLSTCNPQMGGAFRVIASQRIKI